MKSKHAKMETATVSGSSTGNTTVFQSGETSNNITTSVVRSIEEFSELHDEWDELLMSSKTESFFLSWEWLYTWMEIYAGPNTVQWVIVSKKDNEIIGIAPFYIDVENTKESRERKVLRFIGTGEAEEDEVCSYYLDIIARNGYEKVVSQATWDVINISGIQWNEAIFPDLLEQSVMIQYFLPIIKEKGLSTSLENNGIRYCIELPGSLDEYISTLSKKRRKNIRLNTNRIDKQGIVKEYSAETLDEAMVAFDTLKKLHEVRWHKQGEKGVFASNSFTAFHRNIMKRLLDKGWLDLRLLTLQDEPISALYNIKYKKTVFTYQSGFNYPKFSPGLYHDLVAIKDCIETNYPNYDYLKGQGQSYKSSLRSTESQMYIMRIYKSRRSYIYSIIKSRMKEIVKKVRNHLHS